MDVIALGDALHSQALALTSHDFGLVRQKKNQLLIVGVFHVAAFSAVVLDKH